LKKAISKPERFTKFLNKKEKLNIEEEVEEGEGEQNVKK